MGLGRAGPVLGHGAQRICPGAVLPDPVSLQLVTACAMQAFYSLFSAQPGPSCLPAQLNAQIITVSAGCCGGEGTGLLPPPPFPAPLCSPRRCTTTCLAPATCSRCSPGCRPWRRRTSTWAGGERLGLGPGRGEAELCLTGLPSFPRLQKELCWAHLPRLFSAAMNCFLSPHSQVVSAAAQTLEVPTGDPSPSPFCRCRAALVLAGGQGGVSAWGWPIAAHHQPVFYHVCSCRTS